jgi:hypothetical protein
MLRIVVERSMDSVALRCFGRLVTVDAAGLGLLVFLHTLVTPSALNSRCEIPCLACASSWN